MVGSKSPAVVDQLVADLRRQSAAAFIELVADSDQDPELKTMLAQMARDCRRAYEQLTAR